VTRGRGQGVHNVPPPTDNPPQTILARLRRKRKEEEKQGQQATGALFVLLLTVQLWYVLRLGGVIEIESPRRTDEGNEEDQREAAQHHRLRAS